MPQPSETQQRQPQMLGFARVPRKADIAFN